MSDINIYKNWYFNENQKIREFILWEILKDTGAKRHSIDFILEGGKHDLVTRFYKIANYRFLIGQIKERFVDTELEPSWHLFRSVACMKFVNDGQPVDLKHNFNEQIFGFDIIFDIDNKHFKKWWLKTNDLNNPDILKVINENLTIVKFETRYIKKVLDKYKVPYILNFSGSGFRICIEWEDIKGYFIVDDFGNLSNDFIKWVLEQCKDKNWNATAITPSGNEGAFIENPYEFMCFGEMQSGYCLSRALFSIHPISKLVCYALTDDEFDTFTLEMVNPYNVLKNIPNMPKSSQSLNKKRNGSFKEIFEAFRKDVPLNKYATQKKEKEVKNYENIKKQIAELMKQLPENERFLKEGDTTYIIEENEYPHDERCEGNMCYCGNRAKKENPEKWQKNQK